MSLINVTKTHLKRLCLPLFGLLSACSEPPMNEERLSKLYADRAPVPEGHVKIYHLGHSLVGRTMPVILQQLGGKNHEFASQLGWGATLQSHWDPDIPVNGFKEENQHPQFQEIHEAIAQGGTTAYVLTEMVEIKDAIKYFDSAKYLTEFTRKIKATSPQTPIYFYESWHELHNEDEWMNRLKQDYQKHWLGEIVDSAHGKLDDKHTIFIVPVGQVMYEFFNTLKTTGKLASVGKPADIFAAKEDGSPDPIHLNDVGLYLVAVVHYAVLYQKSPEGLTHQVNNEHGELIEGLDEELALLMQKTAWQVVSKDFRTGVTTFK